MITDFKRELGNINPQLLKFEQLNTLQIDLGNRCNQSCVHCHVQAGPNGKKIMSQRVMEKIIGFFRNYPAICVDITGGCPELNPGFKFFIESIYKLTTSLMVRTNLTVFFEPGLNWVPKWYSKHHVVIIGSLPCYTRC